MSRLSFIRQTAALALLASPLCAQDAAPADRTAANSTALPTDMRADSPVKFPEKGALPSKYPEDVKTQSGPSEKDYYLFNSPSRALAQIAAIQNTMPPGDPRRALQVHPGPPRKAQFKNVRLRQF